MGNWFGLSSIYSMCTFLLITNQLAGPGRRLDATGTPSTSKSTKAQSDVYVPPQRKELTSEAR